MFGLFKKKSPEEIEKKKQDFDKWEKDLNNGLRQRIIDQHESRMDAVLADKTYVVLVASSMLDLEQQVATAIKRGYIPVGSVTGTMTYKQAVMIARYDV